MATLFSLSIRSVVFGSQTFIFFFIFPKINVSIQSYDFLQQFLIEGSKKCWAFGFSHYCRFTEKSRKQFPQNFDRPHNLA